MTPLLQSVTTVTGRLPRVHGTRCELCTYEVPALGADPDTELAWFERFEGRPCPRCVGLTIGVVGGLVLCAVVDRLVRRKI